MCFYFLSFWTWNKHSPAYHLYSVRDAPETFSIVEWTWALLSCSLPFDSAQPALFYQHGSIPYLLPYLRCPLGICSVCCRQPCGPLKASRKQNKKFSCVYKHFSLLKYEKPYFEILLGCWCTHKLSTPILYYDAILQNFISSSS